MPSDPQVYPFDNGVKVNVRAVFDEITVAVVYSS